MDVIIRNHYLARFNNNIELFEILTEFSAHLLGEM